MKFATKALSQLACLLIANSLLALPDLCPLPRTTQEKVTFEQTQDHLGPFIDKDREFKDIGTDVVVQQFFHTPDTIYHFMKLVYQQLDGVLAQFRAKNGLDERAIFVLFKGGNVLRMVANELFELLAAEAPEAKSLLSDEFLQYFKRSDADFSVYIDEKKLGNLDYQKTFDDISSLVFAELGKIREKFKSEPDRYFDFMSYSPQFASTVLKKYLNELNNATVLRDKNNSNWYNAKFIQMQLLDDRANDVPKCPYIGREDTLIESKDGKITITKLTKEPDWIVNTENRTLDWAWGSRPDKKIKFYLVRSKVSFDSIVEKNGKLKRELFGGELIDVSIPHRQDDRLRDFLDHYDKNVATYTLKESAGESFTMKAYSLPNLVEDLQFILFDSFKRPWDGQAKYTKRVNRIFFLFIAQMLGNYGVGSKEIANYVDNIKQYIIPPIDILFPLGKGAKELAKDIKSNSLALYKHWPRNKWSNDFFKAFASFIEERIINKPEEGDKEKLKIFLDTIVHNLDIAVKLSKMNPVKIKDIRKVYQVELESLF